VVVVGSGFAGYFAARHLRRRLRKTDSQLTMLSATDGFLYSPLLPDVAVGAVDPRSVVVPLSGTLPDVTITRGRATGVDLDAGIVHYLDLVGEERQMEYDRLLLAPGSVTRLLDIPGLAEHGVGFKTVAEALYLRDHVLDRMEMASSIVDPVRRRATLTFVVVGAGYAGTELTAQMARLTTNLLRFFPDLGPDDLRWILVDMSSAVMPELGEHLGSYALALLRRRNVDVRLGVSVREATSTHVTLTDGTTVECTTLVWCAGVTPNPLIEVLGLPTTRGRLDVDLMLSVPGRPEIYAIGDAAAVPDSSKASDSDGQLPLCPPTAQHAIRQASTVARNIAADLGRGSKRPYHHGNLGLVVDLGGPAAAATPLRLHLHGRLAKIATRGYHLYVLPTVRRRLRVALDWTLGGKHSDDVSFGLLSRDIGLAHSEPTDRPQRELESSRAFQTDGVSAEARPSVSQR
jgi:NADH:ubiquinone reductase (H+-translocating)